MVCRFEGLFKINPDTQENCYIMWESFIPAKQIWFDFQVLNSVHVCTCILSTVTMFCLNILLHEVQQYSAKANCSCDKYIRVLEAVCKLVLCYATSNKSVSLICEKSENILTKYLPCDKFENA